MRQRPFRPNEVTGVAVRIFFKIILMLGLGLPERSGRGHLGDNLARPKEALIKRNAASLPSVLDNESPLLCSLG
jgi:hypothetical protein